MERLPSLCEMVMPFYVLTVTPNLAETLKVYEELPDYLATIPLILNAR